MKIDKLNVYLVRLPFKGEFSISKLDRLFSDTIIAELVCNEKGLKGYGEGLPVEFVTGETPQTVMDAIKVFVHHRKFPRNFQSIQQVWDFVDALPSGKKNNAAICALETALLDLLGQAQGKSALEYFDHTFFTPKIHYSGTVTLGSRDRVMELCHGIKSLGIKHVRVKMADNFQQNQEILEIVRCVLGNECELRVDPNGVWDTELAFRHLSLFSDLNVKVVEEPMPRHTEGFEDFAQALKNCGIYLMACESAPTLREVKRIAAEGLYKIINVKISRSGGFRRSLRIIDFIRKNGLFFQIGCTIGESGILSSAGRVLGLLCNDALCYDGSYDAYILQKNVTSQDVGFGFRGEAGRLEGNGLGIQVDPHRLKSLTQSSVSITF
ncbi:MAG: hypothetical protein DRH12_04770 [Deltaproteobacteria bacterium]|nr:MAG: hypothetical protein DRH12_04770 [Deltaproteobacteria bacterium]